MKKLVVFFTINLLLIGCSIDRTTNTVDINEQNLIKEFHELNSENRLTITDEQEPGEKLTLCITLINKKTKKILKNQKIHFFQTNFKGEYQPKVPDD